MIAILLFIPPRIAHSPSYKVNCLEEAREGGLGHSLLLFALRWYPCFLTHSDERVLDIAFQTVLIKPDTTSAGLSFCRQIVGMCNIIGIIIFGELNFIK